jgi:PAS domain S-box-containing protein
MTKKLKKKQEPDSSKNSGPIPDSRKREETSDQTHLMNTPLESEELYRSLFELSPDGIVTVDLKGKAMSCNPAFLELSGYSEEEIIGKHFTKFPFFRVKDVPNYVKVFGSLIKGKVPEPFNNKWLHKNGSTRHGNIRFGLLKKNGKIVGIQTIARDITEQKQIEEELKAEQAFTQAALNSIVDTFYVFRVNDGKAVRWNSSLEEISGYSSEEVSSMISFDFYPESEHEKMREATKKIIETGQTTIELTGRTKDGRLIPFEYIATLIKDKSGEPLYICSVGRDTTERKRAEEALQESEERFRSLSLASFEGISITDEGVFIDANEQLLSILGYTRDELIGKKIIDIVVPEHHNIVKESVATKKEDHYEVKSICKDGRIIDVEVRPRFMEMGGKRFRLTAIRDVTERKRFEESLRKSEERFRNIVESSPMGMHMYQLEPDGNLVFTGANPAADKILGIDNNQFIGKTIEEAFPPLADTEVPQRYRSAAAEGIPWFTEQISYTDEKISGAFEVHAYQTSPGGMVAQFLDITGRKRVEEALTESENRLRTLSEATFEGIAITEKGVCVDANQQLVSILGYEMDELIGLEVSKCVAPEDVDFVQSKIMEGVEEPYEHRALRKDGEIIFVEVHARMMEIKGEQVRVTVIRDISERKLKEKALEESELRFRSLIEQTTDAVFCYEFDSPISIDLPIDEQVRLMYDSTLVECNEVCAKAYGDFLPEDVIGKKLTDLFGTHSGSLDDLFTALVQGNYQIVDGEGVEKMEDGTERYFLNNGHCVVDNDKILRVWGTFRDITKRKQAENELQKSEERFRVLYNNSPDMYVSVSPDDASVLMCNETLLKNTGYSRDEIIGSPIFKLYHDDCMDEVKIAFQQFVDTGKIRDKELILKRKDGSIIEVSLNVDAIKDESGKTLYSISSWRDITERKRIEEEIRNLNEELEQRVANRTAQLKASNEELESFSYSISHDLRAPLRAINSFSAILKEEYGKALDEEGNRYLDILRTSTLKMDRLINDLLSLARLGRREINYQSVNITLLAKRVSKEVIANEMDRSINIKVADCPSVVADASLLEILLTNLFSNAVKFTKGLDTAEIEFGVTEEEDSHVYFIKDNGIGFDMAYADNLFSPFQRLHSEEDFEGTGIGLAISRRIVRRHGGHIWVEAEPEKGATFYFTIQTDNIKN